MNNKNIPPYEQQLIIAHILGKSREYVLAHPEVRLNEAQKRRFEALAKKRLKHEPMAYILGRKGFYGLDFKVTQDTLIPRPETEMLVELATRNLKLPTRKNKNVLVIDVGTGSGNIIISIAQNLKRETRKREMKFYGVDISEKALRVARQNANKHKVDKKIEFLQSDLLKYFIDHCSLFTGHCVIVSNLPYLSKKNYNRTMPDVKNFEPKSALYSPKEGLAHYEKLFRHIKKIREKCFVFHSRPASRLSRVSCFVEISPEQKELLRDLIKKYFPESKIRFQKDLAGRWRLASLEI